MIGNRYVQPSKKDGGWEILKEGHRRATGHAPTEAQAVEQARRLARRDGGGEVRVRDRTGKIAKVRVVRSPARKRSSR
jgi:hypothetical protein